MGNEIAGNRHLSGVWGEVWFNGFKIAECNKLDVKVTVNREEVQVGIDIDTKITGLKGEGTLGLVKTYTRFEDIRKEISRGRDPRGTIITKLKDPDAHREQTERYQIGNVALNEFPFGWEKGQICRQDIPFGFTPTDLICLDEISV